MFELVPFLTMIMLAFGLGAVVGSARKTKQVDSFNANMLPPADDERWSNVAEKYKCATHRVEHAAYRLGHVTVLKGCGFYVASDYRWQPEYANEVFARQSERRALESWDGTD